MVNKKIIEKDEKDLFFQNIKSITSEILKDKNLTKKNFCKKYGHLRPSTYDISSKNYRENYDSLFKQGKLNHSKTKKIPKFKLSEKSNIKIKKFLKILDKNITLKKFISYLIKGIQYREYSKFIFTKSIDHIFDEIKYLSTRNAINIAKLCHLNIKMIKELYYNLNNKNMKDLLEKNIKENIDDFKFNQFIELPQVIIEPNDVFYFTEKLGTPNFFGNKSVESKIYYLSSNDFDTATNIVASITDSAPGTLDTLNEIAASIGDNGNFVGTVSNFGDVDTVTTAPTNGQALVWNSTNLKWEPGNVAASGGGSGPTNVMGQSFFEILSIRIGSTAKSNISATNAVIAMKRPR